VINIEDYLEEFVSPEPFHSDHDAEIIDFHGELNREEIGKWVDRISDLPDKGNEDCFNDGSSLESDDPYFRLAELFISNDLI